ncbi:unnamed protein product [Adineta steineri]|uniref:BZIP domain-containing protein n=1 Tax=Adineta steineri TaxID=433720 RepID=A0A813XVY1_9BILA|nr:unnamed protein product [Adineta steineri]CAF0870748.1 unnamed protein product [Adineta steineri]CAF1016156.1 unnamed protein product [Adineta steineri]
MADQMEQNEENTNVNPQQLFLQYLFQSLQKQQQQQKQTDEPIDFSTKITEQSSLSIQNKHNQFTHPFSSYLSSISDNSNTDILKQFNRHKQDLSIPLKKRSRSNTSTPPPLLDTNPNSSYSERRKKNNEAAKRSRDARRIKEDEIAIRATWLEQENLKLRLENAQLKQENVQLRCKIYNSNES